MTTVSVSRRKSMRQDSFSGTRRAIIAGAVRPKGGPPQQHDEETLKRNTRTDRRGWSTPESDACLCRVNVRWQDREHEHDQGGGGDSAGARDQQPHGAKDFADAGERDHERGVRHRGRHHRNHVGAHAVEVGRSGEAEHHRHSEPGTRCPSPQGTHTGVADQASDQRNDHENDQRRHGWFPVRAGRAPHGTPPGGKKKRADPEAPPFSPVSCLARADRAVRSRSRPRRRPHGCYSTGSTPCEPTASSGSTKYSISRSSSSSSSDGCSTGGGGGGSSAGIV